MKEMFNIKIYIKSFFPFNDTEINFCKALYDLLICWFFHLSPKSNIIFFHWCFLCNLNCTKFFMFSASFVIISPSVGLSRSWRIVWKICIAERFESGIICENSEIFGWKEGKQVYFWRRLELHAAAVSWNVWVEFSSFEMEIKNCEKRWEELSWDFNKLHFYFYKCYHENSSRIQSCTWLCKLENFSSFSLSNQAWIVEHRNGL